MPGFLKHDELTDKGRLRVRVCLRDISRPVRGAVVRIYIKGGVDGAVCEVKTDISGLTPVVELAAPPLEFSMEPHRPKPFSEYDIVVTAEGMETAHVSGIQVFPGAEAHQEVCFESAKESHKQIVIVEEPVLWGVYPPKIQEQPVKKLAGIMGALVIPQRIVVHDGAPSNASVKNYTVSFKDYIKNATCCVVYPNWPQAALKATVLTVISFALNRSHTEWYRSRGYDFTLTSSAAFDQPFCPGRNTYREVSTIVDELFASYITKSGVFQPLCAQYCDGPKTAVPGRIALWGAKDMSARGCDENGILKAFYGQDAYIARADRIEGVSQDFTDVLRAGMSGEDVAAAQKMLNTISNNYPVLRKLAVDGVYGPLTRASVEAFQNIFGLPVTGEADFASRHQLSYVCEAVAGAASLI